MTTGPVSWMVVACAWAAGLAFCVTANPGPASMLVLVALLLGGLARGRLELSRSLLIVVGVVCVVLTLPFTRRGDFVAVSFFRVPLALALFLAVCLARRATRKEELGVYWAAFLLGIFSLASFQASVYSLAPAVGLFTVALSLGFRQRSGARFSWTALATMAPALLIAAGLALTLRWSETKVNQIMSFLTPSMSATFDFGRDSRLTSMLQAIHNPMIVARVFSRVAPTHLVGRCYLTYTNSTWTAPKERQDVEGKNYTDRWAYRLGPDGQGAPVEERIELPGQGRTLFFPRDAASLTTGVARLQQGFGGVYESNADFGGSYVLRRYPNQFLDDPLPAHERAAYLQLPDALDPVVARLAREWSDGATDDLDRARRLEGALQTKIQYGFGYPFPPDKDPVVEFLTRKPAAHCELFASSLALMLRTQHIPTRYLNGFLVKERSPGGVYAIVRGQDAHAWVEAFIDGRWVHLDPTPPLAIPERDDLSSWMGGVIELLTYTFGKLTRLEWGELLSALVQGTRRYGPWLAGLGALYLAWRYRPQWVARAHQERPSLSPELLPQWLAEVEAAVQSTRPPHRTLLEWGNELEEGPLRGFLFDYCAVRYGQREPSQEDLERLRLTKSALIDAVKLRS